MKLQASILGIITVASLAMPAFSQATSLAPITNRSTTSTPTALESEETYKRRLTYTLTNNDVVDTLYRDNGDYTSWAVVKVNRQREFKVYHTTNFRRGMLVNHWFDHPVIAMKVCVSDGFDTSDCKVFDSDTATIPEGKTIKDLSISIRYSESGNEYTNTFKIPKDAKPDNPKRGMRCSDE
jgi:hypothetical protein